MRGWMFVWTQVTISFAKILIQSIRPGIEVLGRVPRTEAFCDVSQYPMAISTPGILVIRISSGSLCFANANFVRERQALSKPSRDNFEVQFEIFFFLAVFFNL